MSNFIEQNFQKTRKLPLPEKMMEMSANTQLSGQASSGLNLTLVQPNFTIQNFIFTGVPSMPQYIEIMPNHATYGSMQLPSHMEYQSLNDLSAQV